MAFLLAAVLIVLSAGVLVYPFLKHRYPAADDAPGDDVGTADREMESLLEDMRILHLDHQSGNIPDGLYQEQLQAYRLRAASHLRQRTEGQSKGADWDLEQEVLMVRLSAQAQDSSGPAEPVRPIETKPDSREDSES